MLTFSQRFKCIFQCRWLWLKYYLCICLFSISTFYKIPCEIFVFILRWSDKHLQAWSAFHICIIYPLISLFWGDREALRGSESRFLHFSWLSVKGKKKKKLALPFSLILIMNGSKYLLVKWYTDMRCSFLCTLFLTLHYNTKNCGYWFQHCTGYLIKCACTCQINHFI